MTWKVRYFESVESWLNGLNKPQLKSIAKELRLVEMCGNELRLPHSKSLGGGLFELRERRFGLRVYYCFDENSIVLLLHAGDKGSQKNDIKVAKNILAKVKRG
jgi:putative addiction module killer protein